jgi:hypothetical protein
LYTYELEFMNYVILYDYIYIYELFDHFI